MGVVRYCILGWELSELVDIKVEYHANAKYQNPYQNSEKIAYIGQRLMYPIMAKKIIPHHASLTKKCHLIFK